MNTTPPDVTVADTVTRLTDDDHEALRLWLRLLACTKVIETEVRQGLHREFGTTLPRFDFLAQLERVPNGLRMGELSQRMMVTGGNVTGIAAALEEEGLIDRQPDPNDRRIFRVKLTESGRRTFGKMAKARERWIVALFAGLGDDQQEQLNRLLAGLKTHLTAD
jgi:DNA-binding MarR family transcriptional regulator